MGLDDPLTQQPPPQKKVGTHNQTSKDRSIQNSALVRQVKPAASFDYPLRGPPPASHPLKRIPAPHRHPTTPMEHPRAPTFAEMVQPDATRPGHPSVRCVSLV